MKRVTNGPGEPSARKANDAKKTKTPTRVAKKKVATKAMSPDAPKASLFHGSGVLPFSGDDALLHVTSKDRKLARIIGQVGAFGLQLRESATPFETLAESILHQQITGRAAAAISARLRTAFEGGSYPSPEQILRARAPKLRGVGLSASKALAMKDLAAKVLDGTVPTFEAMHTMNDDEIVERLVAVRGIGRWTVEMLLIFRLGRPDVLPSTDYGVRKGFAHVYRMKELPTPGEILRHGERWRPFRTLASWYLWRAAELS